MKDWQSEAFRLYKEGKKVKEIASIVEKSRKTVSAYVNSLPFPIASEIKNKRKEISIERREEQKKAYKDRTTEAQKSQLKRQHEIDVMVLSRERFFN